jgi:hypothetical protein
MKTFKMSATPFFLLTRHLALVAKGGWGGFFNCSQGLLRGYDKSTYGMGLAGKFFKVLLTLKQSLFTRRRRLFIFSFFWKLKIKNES